jgi:AraC family transcriptional regulator of adaptative response / DNA-3-methyladenine glycosylase II
MRLIAHGIVDREGVQGLAARLGYTARQLQRLLHAETGTGPLALARAQRAQTARRLIETTAMPFGDIAYAAGFSSIRQFNDTLRVVYDSTPTRLRLRATATPGDNTTSPGIVSLRLPVRAPFAYAGVFGHLAASVVPGCERCATAHTAARCGYRSARASRAWRRRQTMSDARSCSMTSAT